MYDNNVHMQNLSIFLKNVVYLCFAANFKEWKHSLYL